MSLGVPGAGRGSSGVNTVVATPSPPMQRGIRVRVGHDLKSPAAEDVDCDLGIQYRGATLRNLRRGDHTDAEDVVDAAQRVWVTGVKHIAAERRLELPHRQPVRGTEQDQIRLRISPADTNVVGGLENTINDRVPASRRILTRQRTARVEQAGLVGRRAVSRSNW